MESKISILLFMIFGLWFFIFRKKAGTVNTAASISKAITKNNKNNTAYGGGGVGSW